jgi:hypothetical protein
MFSVPELFTPSSLAGLANSVRQAFEGVCAQAQAAFYAQHDGNGAHTSVTATSIASAGLVTFPRVGFRPTPFTYGAGGARGVVVSPDIGGTTITEAWEFANVDRAGVIIPDLSSGGATVYGLSVRNREAGDVVALLNFQGYNADLVLRLNPSGSFEGEFAGNLSTPNVDVTLPRGRWVWLMLMNMPQATALRWHVHHF